MDFSYSVWKIVPTASGYSDQIFLPISSARQRRRRRSAWLLTQVKRHCRSRLKKASEILSRMSRVQSGRKSESLMVCLLRGGKQVWRKEGKHGKALPAAFVPDS